jgi:hypothetical protein
MAHPRYLIANLFAAFTHGRAGSKLSETKCSCHGTALSNYMESGKSEKLVQLMECGFGIRDRGSYGDCRRILERVVEALYNLIGRRSSLGTGENPICASRPQFNRTYIFCNL